ITASDLGFDGEGYAHTVCFLARILRIPAESLGSSEKPQEIKGQDIRGRSIPCTTIKEVQIGQFRSSPAGSAWADAASASTSTAPIDRTPGHLGLSLQTQMPAISNNCIGPPQMEQFGPVQGTWFSPWVSAGPSG